jgi:hypothetical protein
MFGQYFGRYLVEKDKISKTEFEAFVIQQQDSRIKLGLIAVAEKLLTTKQAEEINDIQKKIDKRFGDIAIEKGYLLPEEVTHLLNMQGNPYLKFVQSMTENHIMTLEKIEKNLEAYKLEKNFSNADIDALKSGDINRIIPVFINTEIPFCGQLISLTIRNIVRFINPNILLKRAYTANKFSFDNLAYQQMIGNQRIFVGFAGNDCGLLNIAKPFAKENFTKMDEYSFDSICEFINCNNGLYASKLSLEDIHIDMTPPLFTNGNKILETDGDIHVVPIIINGAQTDLLIVANSQVSIN